MKPIFALLLGAALLLAAACQKPDIHSQEAVQDALAKYVRAIQKGDGEAFYTIHSTQQQQQLEELRKPGFPPRKSFEFKFEGMLMRTRTAGVFGRYVENGTPGDDQALLFVLENGQWRLDRTLGSNDTIHRPAFAPPESGKFSDAGLPWQDVPAQALATAPAEAEAEATAAPDATAVPTAAPAIVRVAQLQAAADESFLYFRLQFADPLPAPGTALADPIKGLPNIVPNSINIATAGGKESFELRFDTTTVSHFRAGQNSYTLGYDQALYGPAGKFIFNSNAGAEEKLLLVGEREIIAKIPLESLAAVSATGFKLVMPQRDGKLEFQAKQY